MISGVVLFAHGSVLCGADQMAWRHAGRLRERSRYRDVEVGFLNYTEPSFEEAVRRCIDRGAATVYVVPYFLVPGKFVTVDLPAAIETVRRRNPHANLIVGNAIGYHELLADAILESALHASTAEAWNEQLRKAAAFCRNSSVCPLFETAACPHETGSKDALSACTAAATERPAQPASRSALLVIAHGSPRSAANADLYRLIDLCRARSEYLLVQAGFLECNEPSIPAAIDLCVDSGVDDIIAVPYFLHTGKHVVTDLPEMLERGRLKHPAIGFRLGEYIGTSERVTDVLEKRLQEAVRDETLP